MTTEINLQAMRFQARVGILPQELDNPQPIEVDLRVELRDGDGVVDYRALYDIVAGVLGSGHIDYLEEIGGRVGRAVLALSTRVRAVRVAVRKPRVALGGPLDFAEVVVSLNADG